ncbi:MAG: zinc finger domain-containing protein [Candidatus Woesearchaeota archaeon]
MAKEFECDVLKTKLTNDRGSAVFLCPSCSKGTICRSRKARDIVIKYKCSECGFEGPN